MQYWKPDSGDEFAGDMMPYWDGKRFHLFYLLDRSHHAEQGGLGGHQWAHASTSDLVEWEHHPLAVPIGEPGSVDQHGICTGSIFEQDGVYHAFYATRLKRPDGSVYEALCRAVSRDLIHFDKSPDNPMFGAPPGLDPRNHRDPFVFLYPETGPFHMLVTASGEAGASAGDGLERGVLAHYTSDDMDQWHYEGPFLALDKDPTPECPEHFFWNGWWYLVFSQWAEMQYRISRHPLGPWEKARRVTIEGENLAVPRTASFTGGRRLAVGFLRWRQNSRDDGEYVYAGNTVFRELLQDPDGTLTTRFVPEMMPRTGPPIPWRRQDERAEGVREDNGVIYLDAPEGVAMARLSDTPADGILSCRITPQAGTTEYGLLLRADAQMETGYRLSFFPLEKRVTLQRSSETNPRPRAAVYDVEGLDQSTHVVVCLKDSLIDVCVNDRHTLIERCFDHRGMNLGLFVRAGGARIENPSISPLLSWHDNDK